MWQYQIIKNWRHPQEAWSTVFGVETRKEGRSVPDTREAEREELGFMEWTRHCARFFMCSQPFLSNARKFKFREVR